MAKTVIPPSTVIMTAGQIDELVASYRAQLEKYSRDFPFEAVQIAINKPGLVEEQLAVFRRRVETVSIRTVKVNRGRTNQETIEATGHTSRVDLEVLDAMPRGEGSEATVVFFKPEPEEYSVPGFMSNEDLEKAYERRGLKPADPISVAAVNEADPAFVDEKPHGTHWKDDEGNWCYASFDCWVDGHQVIVDRGDDTWSDGWWFAGFLN